MCVHLWAIISVCIVTISLTRQQTHIRLHVAVIWFGECSPLCFVSFGHWFCLQIKVWVCFLHAAVFLHLQDSLLQWAGGDFCSERAEHLWRMPEKGRDLPSALCCLREWEQDHLIFVLGTLNCTRIHLWG